MNPLTTTKEQRIFLVGSSSVKHIRFILTLREHARTDNNEMRLHNAMYTGKVMEKDA